MRNATIATSRTRATADQLIDYRPLPAEWGDREALQAVRASRARAALRGEDPSTLQLPAPPEEPPRSTADRPHRTTRLAALLRPSGLHRRAHARGRRLTTA